MGGAGVGLRPAAAVTADRRSHAMIEAMRLKCLLLVLLPISAVVGCGKSAEERAAEMDRKVAAARIQLDAKEAADAAVAAKRQAAEDAAKDAAAAQQMVAMVRSQMIDPTSATFDRVVVKRAWLSDNTGRTSDAICGQVNGKNKFGGFTGAQTFFGYLGSGEKPVVWFSGQDEPFRSIALKNAKDMGCTS